MCSQYFDSVNIHLRNIYCIFDWHTPGAQLIGNLQHLPRQNKLHFENSKSHSPPYDPCLQHKECVVLQTVAHIVISQISSDLRMCISMLKEICCNNDNSWNWLGRCWRFSISCAPGVCQLGMWYYASICWCYQKTRST